MMAKSDARRTRSDWIAAASAALARAGIVAVRVEALARDLGVTKGSFYWHFADLPALLQALFEAWEQRSTLDIIALVEAKGGSAEARLRRLWAMCSRPDIGPELGLRDLARHDAHVAQFVERVDDERMDYLRKLLVEHGCPAGEIEARALLIYSLLIGNWFIGTKHGRKRRKTVLEEAVSLLLDV